mmetsp:Transcript_129382/g.360372  ORF Transcript_129382/g.360372 Transcript_129382/m.360372 type:complete len:363 (+) Transcript_129382:855-1943(+)
MRSVSCSVSTNSPELGVELESPLAGGASLALALIRSASCKASTSSTGSGSEMESKAIRSALALIRSASCSVSTSAGPATGSESSLAGGGANAMALTRSASCIVSTSSRGTKYHDALATDSWSENTPSSSRTLPGGANARSPPRANHVSETTPISWSLLLLFTVLLMLPSRPCLMRISRGAVLRKCSMTSRFVRPAAPAGLSRGAEGSEGPALAPAQAPRGISTSYRRQRCSAKCGSACSSRQTCMVALATFLLLPQSDTRRSLRSPTRELMFMRQSVPLLSCLAMWPPWPMSALTEELGTTSFNVSGLSLLPANSCRRFSTRVMQSSKLCMVPPMMRMRSLVPGKKRCSEEIWSWHLVSISM